MKLFVKVFKFEFVDHVNYNNKRSQEDCPSILTHLQHYVHPELHCAELR